MAQLTPKQKAMGTTSARAVSQSAPNAKGTRNGHAAFEKGPVGQQPKQSSKSSQRGVTGAVNPSS
jgi:hypothetical protein